ncbi:MAG: phenylalanine--tRNA ligase subunit alpha [Candidatus Nezhaarchaeales archaeon]
MKRIEVFGLNSQKGLRKQEFELLKALKRLGGVYSAEHLADILKVDKSSLMSLAASLASRGLVKVSRIKEEFVKLTEEGLLYAKGLLPERLLYNALKRLGGTAPLNTVANELKITSTLLNIALSWAKRKGWIELKKIEGLVYLSIKSEAFTTPDEELLKLIYEKERINVSSLKAVDPLNILKTRNLVSVSTVFKNVIELTSLGSSLADQVPAEEEVSALTSDLIRSGVWKYLKLKPYDVKAQPPSLLPGRKHVYLEFLDDVRRILIGMGFEEATGPYVELEFWNFDILFQPQDHPAREIHGSYILKDPPYGDVEDKEVLHRVRRIHEDGWTTSSKGWGYAWNEEIAKRLVLRTQTTAVSMRYLYEHRLPPVKMFCLSKVFRPDVLDAKHSMEFTQLEGIVGDRGINLRHLLGILKSLAESLGLKKLKFKPGYFPFTEPSVEGFVYHPKLGWVEFVGAGMFRPEVLKALEVDFPVIAWGIGIERLAMAALGINDIRMLYSKDLNFLREKPIGWW